MADKRVFLKGLIDCCGISANSAGFAVGDVGCLQGPDRDLPLEPFGGKGGPVPHGENVIAVASVRDFLNNGGNSLGDGDTPLPVLGFQLIRLLPPHNSLLHVQIPACCSSNGQHVAKWLLLERLRLLDHFRHAVPET